MAKPKDIADWTFRDLQSECSEIVVDTILREGIRNFTGMWTVIFSIYDQWRTAQEKKTHA